MSWISALSGWQWALLGVIPPGILLLYFLKLRRQPLEVPSTFLWKRTIEDLHVNSIWQKLRQNLLLYLQLLFMAAVILACLRPGLSGNSEAGKRWIFLLDNSASMQATDESPTRLDFAKKRMLEQIDTMRSGDVAMVLAFSDRADVRQGFTGDKRKLTAAVQSIEPTNRTTDLNEALRASAGLANPGRVSFGGVNDVQVAEALPATLYIYSDGGFAAIDNFDLGNLKAEYVPIGHAKSDNVGILAFTAQRNEEKENEVQAFGRLTNEGSEDVTVVATLYRDRELVDATNVEIAAGEEAGVNFELNQIEGGALRLELDVKDSLAIDNVAYAALRPARLLSLLLLTPGNSALETSLQTGALKKLAEVSVESPEYMDTPEYAKRIAASYYDLILFDQCKPKVMPNANTFFIGVPAPMENWKFGEPKSPVFLVEWDKRHPIVQYLEMASVRILEGFTVEPPEGGTVLMRSDDGPVMSVAPRGPYQDAVMGFPLVTTKEGETEVNTDWAIKRSFPIFVYSVVEYLGGGITTSSASTVLPGNSIAMNLSTRHDQFRIEDPNGKSSTVQRGVQSQIIYTKTETPGIYRVFTEDQPDPTEIFAVNLYSPRESAIGIVEDLQLGGQPIESSKIKITGRKEWWRWVLLLGLGLLLVEWMVYNRRVFV